MRKLEWTKKIIVIVLGSIVAAYGITLAMYAGFGGATLAVLWQGIAQTFHISIGMASMVIALLRIAFVLFYYRSQLHIGTILYQIVYSFCVDLFADAHIYSRYAWLNVFLMVVGVALGGKFGICTIVTILVSGPVIQHTATGTKKLLKL